MLRAVTDDMVNVFVGIIALAAVFALLKLRLGLKGKAGIVVAAIVAALFLKSVDAKFIGVLAMGGAVVIMFFLPWLDCSPVKSIRYRPGWHKGVLAVFVVVFLVLGYLGTQPPSPVANLISQAGTLMYFGFFLLMPWWSRLGTFKPVPERVTFHPH